MKKQIEQLKHDLQITDALIIQAEEAKNSTMVGIFKNKRKELNEQLKKLAYGGNIKS